MKQNEGQRPAPSTPVPVAVERVLDALDGLRFGTVTIVVQDGVVVQVERTEKFRLGAR